MEVLSHLLILCCYGGVPFIDYRQLGDKVRHDATMMLDPTDWIAVDTRGSLLNDSIHPELLAAHPNLKDLIPKETTLDRCDLYNLTFSSLADEHLYQEGHGHLSCRCPSTRTGSACQTRISDVSISSGIALPLKTQDIMYTDPATEYMLTVMIIMAVMIGVFMFMRGCFCDVFGGIRNPLRKPNDDPLDPVAISRCINAVNEYEKKQQQRNLDVRRPLITNVSEGNAAPYNDTVFTVSNNYRQHVPPPLTIHVPTAPTAPRSHSPPPPYRSEAGSLESIPQSVMQTNTRL